MKYKDFNINDKVFAMVDSEICYGKIIKLIRWKTTGKQYSSEYQLDIGEPGDPYITSFIAHNRVGSSKEELICKIFDLDSVTIKE